MKVGDRVIVHPSLERCKDELFVEGYDGLIGTVSDISISPKLEDSPYIVKLDSVIGWYHFAEEELELISDIAKRLIAEKEKKAEKNDVIEHPAHYTHGKIEVIDFIEDQKLNYHLGNCLKYLCRCYWKHPDKPSEDLKKCRWYLDREIAELEAQGR